ncbi:MAG TPA: hypothetical protein DCQ49_04990, partial [Methylophaga sp.]|nr:hypothetical protein [Methylophaga sp.]
MHQFTSRRLTAAFVLSFLLVLSIPSHSNDNAINAIGFKSVQPSLNEDLVRQAPNLNRAVLDKAIAAMTCAVNHGIDQASRLAIIDFSLPSSEPRLWIFDLDSRS